MTNTPLSYSASLGHPPFDWKGHLMRLIAAGGKGRYEDEYAGDWARSPAAHVSVLIARDQFGTPKDKTLWKCEVKFYHYYVWREFDTCLRILEQIHQHIEDNHGRIENTPTEACAG